MPMLRHYVTRLEETPALDRPASALGRLAAAVHPSSAVRALAQGATVGHPLHAAMSDVPVGAWMSSLVLDVRHPGDASSGAATLLRLALVSTVPTAVLGLADFQRLDESQRRVAAVHTTFNSLGVGLGVASLRARSAGWHGRAAVLSAAGATLLSAGGFLGGHIAARLGPPAEPAPERPLGTLLPTE